MPPCPTHRPCAQDTACRAGVAWSMCREYGCVLTHVWDVLVGLPCECMWEAYGRTYVGCVYRTHMSTIVSMTVGDPGRCGVPVWLVLGRHEGRCPCGTPSRA